MCYILQVCDEPVAYMYDTPGKNSWFTTMWQLKAAVLVVNTINIYLYNLHENDVYM